MIDRSVINKRTGKKVLLFSAGMDSFIINKLEEPDILLFIDNNSEYSDIERDYLERAKYKNLVIVDDFIDMSSIELPNMIMPGRNLYFTMIAANFGEEIILGATAGDRSTDKDFKFAELTSQLLSHIYSESHWCTKGDIHINLKYKGYTKQDLVKAYVTQQTNLGRTVESCVDDLITESFSCYHPFKHPYGDGDGEQCNKCKPDLRKYLAILGATGLSIDDYYITGNKPSEFFTPEVKAQWIAELTVDKSRGRESEETIRALELI